MHPIQEELKNHGLYDPSFEHEACGVGFVVNMKGGKSHKIVTDGVQILLNLAHRGACGCDPKTGDGAGILIQIPHRLFKAQEKALGFSLPEPGNYAVGMLFLPQDPKERAQCEQILTNIIQEEGQVLLGFRDVPTDNSDLGKESKAVEPVVRQAFIQNKSPNLGQDAFERKLYLISKRAEHEIHGSTLKQAKLFFIVSLSSRTLVYKGMLLADQLKDYFPDLENPALESALALVHSRFSTNTFPAWGLAHPYRYLAHNGEINTLKGNRNWMATRQQMFQSEYFGADIKKLFPIITPDGSDSFSLDNALELLHMGGRSLPHAMLMLIPEAWQGNPGMDPKKRNFYEYHATTMEPWDGPACVAFTDGQVIGAVLDRNGLRPSRFMVTSDDVLIMASETGVLDIPDEKVVQKGRLQPGKMLLVDIAKGRLVSDEEIKQELAQSHPYDEWVRQVVDFKDLPAAKQSGAPTDFNSLLTRQKIFGYTTEDLRMILQPMVEAGQEPIGSMGTDTPIAVLSDQAPLLFWYFKQLFAQVTNPPIDPIREELVMSLVGYLGSEGNLLDVGSSHCHRIRLKEPLLFNPDLEKLREVATNGFKSKALPILFEKNDDAKILHKNLREALANLFAQAKRAILEEKCNLIIISDRGADAKHIPIPSLLATSGLHHFLIQERLRTYCSIIVESGEPREVSHFALLIGYGANAINPYLALESLEDLQREGYLDPKYKTPEIFEKYRKAVNKCLYKVFSKMGISTFQSYNGAQIFEAIGLNRSVIDQYFTGTISRLEGVGLEVLAKEAYLRHRVAYPQVAMNVAELPVGGQYHFRVRGEYHSWNPESVAIMQRAVRENRYETFKTFSQIINEQNQHLCTLRGLLKFKPQKSIPLAEVEPVSEIVKRFATGAMSFGSISKEAHETLAIAMNRIGGKSNTGEGGEEPERFIPLPNGDSRRSAIKQVASGRFGVTTHYLVNADELQIKMAQGAKPGEGGQLPGHKVDRVIARTRYSTPGVGLISPPPHHDIYSIEDLAQLIFDLKNVNPQARITVKLVAESGVGTVAAGVAKAHADMILISGYDGGTGASPLSSIKHAGIPWEIGLAETQQILVAQNLRSRTAIQTDGQLKTGRDVIIATLLGAEEFGFATAPLVATGCILMRKCHLNTCPVGIATQNPELRKKFTGTPEHVINYFFFVAEEIRELMAQLGFRRLVDMVGRTDVLDVDAAVNHWKARGLDLSPVLYRPRAASEVGTHCQMKQDHGIDKILDHELIAKAQPAIEKGEFVQWEMPIRNIHRTTGAMLSGILAKKYGPQGLPDATIKVKFKGSAGQSFGAFLMSGVEFTVEGDTNDYMGKGLFGGRIIVYPPKDSKFVPEQNIIVGNVLLYGAIRGEAFIRGLAGERFCVRNSGATAIVEGLGDHGCEYMTGGRVVVIGPVGRNFAAGMSGGVAYVLDEQGDFRSKCNLELVALETLDSNDEKFVKQLIMRHEQYTDSTVAKRILKDWDHYLAKFLKVMPTDYKLALKELEEEGETDTKVA